MSDKKLDQDSDECAVGGGGPVRKETGMRHLFATLTYSFDGFKYAFRESAFRQELVVFCVAMVLFAISGAAAVHYLIGLILFLILIAFEALNTTIEHIVDRVSPEKSEFGKQVKDLGSFAVFCLLCANGIFALYVLAQAILA